MSNIIETTAPIDIVHLKEFFKDKTISFLIQYDASTLKGEKLLTYLSNLDIPCDIKFETEEGMMECLEAYLNTTNILNCRTLEMMTLNMLCGGDAPEHLKKILDHWKDRLNALPNFNVYSIQSKQFENFADSLEQDDTDTLVGVNWISLLKNSEFNDYFENNETNSKFFTKYFNDYMFKGKNLYHYWANERNITFLLTLDFMNFISKKEELKNAESVSPQE